MDNRLRGLGEVRTLAQSYRRTLLAENKSPATISVYISAVDRLADYLESTGMPSEVAAIRREHVESFIGYLLEHFAPATASNRHRALQTFFKWCVEEGEILPRRPRHARHVVSRHREARGRSVFGVQVKLDDVTS